MPDNFYTLDPIDQQVALAYAQTLLQNGSRRTRTAHRMHHRIWSS